MWENSWHMQAQVRQPPSTWYFTCSSKLQDCSWPAWCISTHPSGQPASHCHHHVLLPYSPHQRGGPCLSCTVTSPPTPRSGPWLKVDPHPEEAPGDPQRQPLHRTWATRGPRCFWPPISSLTMISFFHFPYRKLSSPSWPLTRVWSPTRALYFPTLLHI